MHILYCALSVVALLSRCEGTDSRNSPEQTTDDPSKKVTFVTFFAKIDEDQSNNVTSSHTNDIRSLSLETTTLMPILDEGLPNSSFSVEDSNGQVLSNHSHVNEIIQGVDTWDNDENSHEDNRDVEENSTGPHRDDNENSPGDLGDDGDNLTEKMGGVQEEENDGVDVGENLYEQDANEDYNEPSKAAYDYSFFGIAICGVLGNALVIVTWSKVKQFNTTTFLLSFLGVGDFFYGCIMIFVQTMMTVDTFTYFTKWMFYILVYLSYIAQFMSIYTTVLVSVTRYLAVKYPFKVQIWFRKFAIQLWAVTIVVFSFLLAYPASTVACLYLYIFLPIADYDYGSPNDLHINSTHLAAEESRFLDGFTSTLGPISTLEPTTASPGWTSIAPPSMFDTNTSMETTQDYLPPVDEIEVCLLSSRYDRVFMMFSAVMTNIVPWVVVIPMNILLINQVRTSFKNRKQMVSKEEQNNQTMNIVVIILTVQSIIAYPLFFLTEMLTNRLEWGYYFGSEPALPIPEIISMHVTSWSEALRMLNSSLNIIAYCACGRRFRKLLREEVLKCNPSKRGATKKPVEKKDIVKGLQSSNSASVSNDNTVDTKMTS